VPKHYRLLELFPTSMCTLSEFVDHMPFSLVAGRYGLAINAGAAARANYPKLATYCQTLELEMTSGMVSNNRLYVLRRDLTNRFRDAAVVPTVCVTLDEHGVCVARETYARWQNEFDVMWVVLPPLTELLAFYNELDAEYQVRLRRPSRPTYAPTEERITDLIRYFWYRLGGCDPADAKKKLLQPEPDDVRICGDPFRRRELPHVEEAYELRLQLESGYRERSTVGPASHVDPEGEAAWLHRYAYERLNGRDAFGAREAVLNAIRAIARSTSP
jgi:hypothetical protein